MPNPYRDDESGEYTTGYTLDDTLAALRTFGGAASTSEVADQLGCARRTAFNKLTELEDGGRVESRKTGGTRLWSPVEGSDSDV